MKRQKHPDFTGTRVITAGEKALPVYAKSEIAALSFQSKTTTKLHTKIAGMTLHQLRNDYRKRIFKEYLPFWDKGGFDKKYGGFMCELYDDGSVENDEKFIWYQGRGIWVYSYLYNNLE